MKTHPIRSAIVTVDYNASAPVAAAHGIRLARAFGVKTGMAVWEAKRCCPELIIVVGDNRKYPHTSGEIMKMKRGAPPST